MTDLELSNLAQAAMLADRHDEAIAYLWEMEDQASAAMMAVLVYAHKGLQEWRQANAR